MQTRRDSMRGFSLLETIVCVAILAAAALGLTSAVLGSTHATTRLISHQTLSDVAADVLTDLRVASAYQPEVLDALYQKPPKPFTVMRLGAAGNAIPIQVSETLVPIGTTPGYDVTIVATAPDGYGESLRQTVIQQAVAPGSTVTQAPIALATSGSYGAGFGSLTGAAPAAVNDALATPAPNVPAAAASSPPDDDGAPPAGCVANGVCWPHGRILPIAGRGE